ncbi:MULTISPECIES: PTS system mannose/fructose/sorbose family transporter subunit IID [unclassified Enterococcus]|uniref:PTS system mannose/fructose/sorbose family transporter subunit IID n=1 Tax=unclassified Enterococcus TaxID=2608891 RepID=UPI001552688F|nr:MULTISPECIES: PTS system mannose/fructose/sorbose family transporter subunit IID [unclassified Enterococcus]MBS7576891.1 PTS mannose/fructose/sorbose transporter family subunit IID [Enterococcus sp. MMGLQ5-2]MBS7584298.1 PTS mannose/fructose/sorbose transporter family subunit IID [Enterococcus sp. MMGLQ5-1]NPD12154.1 PTS mannose/fructose/sorbose transporter family subunit IID [Enterococcus sp. MMGLQ5-1]NPD36726.1 PTS mannose/fructose/sorbose transporter family subunit IID [Enterococcus sp. M
MVEENTPVVLAKKVTKRDIFQTFVYSNFQQASFNYERIHALAFCVDMIPTIKRVYHTKEEQAAALKRHLTFFNVTPAVCGPVIGVTMAMEEGRANGADIDDGTINSLKIGLMGPLCGVGDPLIWGTLRPILAAIGASMALNGQILGPIIFFFAFNAARLALKWYGLTYGLKQGVGIVKNLSGSLLPKLTEGATILGLFIMGVLVTKWTTINVSLVAYTTKNAAGEKVVTTIQNILDDLIPGILALGLTFLMMYLLKKKMSPILLIFILFAVGIIGYGLGILS